MQDYWLIWLNLQIIILLGTDDCFRLAVCGSSVDLFRRCFYIEKAELSLYGILNVGILLVICLSWLKAVLDKKRYTGVKRIVALVCLLLSLLATYIYLFVSKGTVYHMIMQIGNYFVYLGIIMLLDADMNVIKGVRKLVLGLLCILCFYHFLNNNIGYKQMEMSYQRTSFETMELLSLIDEINVEESEGLEFIEGFGRCDSAVVEAVPQITGVSTNNFLHMPFHFVSFANYYFNCLFTLASDARIEEVKNSEEFRSMPAYPNRGCVKIIDGTLVKKEGLGTGAMKVYIREMRIHQYVKNLLIFMALLCSGQLFTKEKAIQALFGCISFCLLSSAIYIVNDIRDREKDSRHPEKCKRPVAAGKIRVKNAVVLVAILLLLSIGFHCYISSEVWSTILLLLYLLLNLGYSLRLKNIPLIDVAILVSGFVIRVLYGAAITGIEISNWLYFTVMAAAFYLALGKRRNELDHQGGGAGRNKRSVEILYKRFSE